jgi:septal ring factor EnvC (AmiA/AmiB activator)
MRIKNLLLALTSVALVAGPASAQTWRVSPSVSRQIQGDINQLERQIQRSEQRRAISQREAQRLRRDAVQLQRTYNRFSRNGLDRQEVRQLEVSVNQVRQQLRLERRDWDGRRN